MESTGESSRTTPEPVADLIAQVHRARSEAEDARLHLELIRGQYGELEAICGTQAEELVRLRKDGAAKMALQEERVKLTARLGYLQSEVNSMRSVTGTLRLLAWQARRLPGLLQGRK